MQSFSEATVLLFFFLCLSIFFNIPIVQPILGFLWLTIIPGYALLRVLKLDEWGLLDKVVFSAGSGLAISIFLGLILNYISPFLGFQQPLSAVPFAIAIGSFTFVLLLLGRNQGRNFEIALPKMGIKLGDISQILVLTTVIALSIAGSLYQNTSILLLMIIGVSLLVAICTFSERLIPSKLFPLVIASCSLALLLQTALISKHLMGVDVFLEFDVFTQTKTAGFWTPPGNILTYSLINDLGSLLSVTTLPTSGSAFLGLEGEVFFKIFYPLVFSIVPLALYCMYKKQFDVKIAFLSTMFFVLYPTVFYGIEPLALCRQIIGMFFLALSSMLLLDKRLASRNRIFLLILFVSALITSHYALSFFFLFYILIFYVIPRVPMFSLKNFNKQTLSLGLVVLIFVLTFSWYTYVSSSPLNHAFESLTRIVNTFSRDFGSSEARGLVGSLSSLSPFTQTTIVGLIHKILFYIQFFFMGIGIIIAAIKPKRFGLSSEYRLLSFASAAILGLCLVVPNLSLTLNPTRFYSIVVLMLAPFFVLGGISLINMIFGFLSKALHKSIEKKSIEKSSRKLGIAVVTFLLIATFLFQVGLVNHVTNDYPYSYSLDMNRKEASDSLSVKVTLHSLYFLDQEVVAAEWLSRMANTDLDTYADWNSRRSVLKSYSTLKDASMISIVNNTAHRSQTYIYLKYITTQLGLISLENGDYLDSSTALPSIESFDRIYANGISDIFFVP